MSQTAAFLLDIEGTTTPLAFVSETLFPYAERRLDAWLVERWSDPSLVEDIRELSKALPSEQPATPQTAASHLHALIARDAKDTTLKSIQGKIWKDGYASGEIRGDIYPDVKPFLQRCQKAKRAVSIYSSGSVLAQKLLFGHSVEGDIRPYLSGYFDTVTGPKKAPESYRSIAKALERQPGAITFISDVVEELDAAAFAGFQTLLSVRPGNKPVENQTSHKKISNFDNIP